VFTLSTQVDYTRMGQTERGVLAMDIRFSAIQKPARQHSAGRQRLRVPAGPGLRGDLPQTSSR
jgi:hypothetical protein